MTPRVEELCFVSGTFFSIVMGPAGPLMGPELLGLLAAAATSI
jgi:hypothetical protein